MEFLYILACAGLPFYLIHDALKDAESRRKTTEEIRTDPFASILTLGLLVGWVGWFLWLLSNEHLASGYFGLFAIACLVCIGIWGKIKRSIRKV